MTIIFSLSISLPPRHRAGFLKSIGALLEPTRVLPDCLGCQIFTNVERPDEFILIEEWASQAALDRHLTSCAGKRLIAAIELSSEPPVIRFDTVAQSAGIEVIEAAARKTREDATCLDDTAATGPEALRGST